MARPCPGRRKFAIDSKTHEETLKTIGDWIPKTKLGKLVKEGKIKTIHEAISSGLPLREYQIVDVLVPELYNVPVDVRMVQRMTDSGRRVKFAVTTVLGNKNGIIGMGRSANVEIRPSIEKSIKDAELNLYEIARGCGSWECGCGRPHTVPFAITGKAGSVEVMIKPAPRGVGLACSDVIKQVLNLAGIEDAWVFTKGKTKTDLNSAIAAFNALVKTARIRATKEQIEKLKIVYGEVSQAQLAPVQPVSAQPAPQAEVAEAWENKTEMDNSSFVKSKEIKSNSALKE